MNAQMIEDKLLAAFPDCEVKATDLTGGGDHWSVTIKSELFNGKTMVQQHQMVYRALGDWMKREIHALALTTKLKGE